ncbi:MAG TPA: aminotransferase class III-fold pyridoxal phosphate-dependent enzyme, partial [Polyangiaceae bacterium]|nr:aminotransferase class III-fold pyridoxal phosphate-dependent enzyme [Polyangiaceae bacterium]
AAGERAEFLGCIAARMERGSAPSRFTSVPQHSAKVTALSHKPQLLPWTSATSLPWKEICELFRQHMNPGLFKIIERLGYDSTQVVTARDVHYRTRDGQSILDCWGGFGTFNVGHNHPRLAAVRRAIDEQERAELGHAFVPAQAAVLAKNLATVMPGDLSVSYLCCTGSEAVEAALKLAQKFHGDRRGRIYFAENAMHGKTHGALSVTGNDRVRLPFKNISDCVQYRFGDAYALRKLLTSHAADRSAGPALAVIVEPIQCGGGVVVPAPGYLRQLRQLCDEFAALLIVDEVQTGFGRTGKLFAFEHDDIVPDIVTLSKALGGGKAAVAACVSRRKVFQRAYGSTDDCTLHNATFNEMTSSTALATEMLHILYDEGLIDNAARVGSYLHTRLDDLQTRFSELLVDVRGRGLLAGIELRNIAELLPGATLGQYLPKLRAIGDGPLAVLVASDLLARHRVLVAFTDFNRNVLRIEPPLTLREEHVDQLIEGLADVLSQGVTGLITRTVERRLLDA